MTPATPIQRVEGRVQLLLLEHRNTPTFERVRLYVAKFSGGRKLSEWLADADVPENEKMRVMSSLEAILSAKDFGRLPELPIGGTEPVLAVIDELPATKLNGDDHEDEFTALSPNQIRAIARREARAELADVLEKVARVLRETS